MTNSSAVILADRLSVDDAKELIKFIFNTNYRVAPQGDGAFDTKADALRHVESEEYDPEIPLSVCFDTLQGDYWDSIDVTASNSVWYGEDGQMGGASASGETIEKMLTSFAEKTGLTNNYCPVKIIFTNSK